MQSKLAQGQTFSKPQERLNRIWELLEEDMVCCFCDSYLFDEVSKVMEWGEYSQDETKLRRESDE